MKVLTLSALCNARIVLFRLPRVLTARERSSAEVCTHRRDSVLFAGPPGRRVSRGVLIQGGNLITCWINILLPCFTRPNCLQVSLARAKARSGGPRPHSLVPDPRWLCVIWYAAVWFGRMIRVTGPRRPGPITEPLLFSASLFPPLALRPLCLCSRWMYPLACRCVNCFHLHRGQMGSSVSVVISYAWAF